MTLALESCYCLRTQDADTIAEWWCEKIDTKEICPKVWIRMSSCLLFAIPMILFLTTTFPPFRHSEFAQILVPTIPTPWLILMASCRTATTYCTVAANPSLQYRSMYSEYLPSTVRITMQQAFSQDRTKTYQYVSQGTDTPSKRQLLFSLERIKTVLFLEKWIQYIII